MRSVFVYFSDATRAETARYFDDRFNRQNNEVEEWVCDSKLYISFYDEAEQELDPDEYAGLQRKLG